MKLRVPVLVVALGCAVGTVSSAVAANVSLSSGTLIYGAAAAEANNLTVSRVGANFVFVDTGAPITPGGGCAAITANSASCAAAPVTTFSISVADLADQVVIDDSVTAVQVNISGSGGADQLTGGENTADTIVGDDFGGAPANDILSGRGGDDRMIGGDGNDTIDGGAGNEFFDGDPGNDTINGGPGFDRLGSGSTADGADTFNGGTETDSVDYRSRTNAVTVSANGVADDGEAGEGDNLGADVEQLTGGQGNDTISGSSSAGGSIQGDVGNDVITGGSGNDSIGGGAGNDTINGGAGNDSINGGAGTDTVDGGAGDDEIASSTFDGQDVYRGGSGNDRANYSGGTSGPVVVSLDGVANDGGADENDNVGTDIEDVLGGSFDDTITGSAAANELDGGSGNDVVNGLGGSDGLSGDRGNDTLDGGAGIDALSGGAGADTLRSRDASADDVLCGGESDIAIADVKDTLRACESVSSGVVIVTSSTRVRTGRVTLALSCPAIEERRCVGTLRLVSGSLLGSRAFSIPSGARRNVVVSLTSVGRRIIGRRPTTAVAASARFTDGAGRAVTTARSVAVRR